MLPFALEDLEKAIEDGDVTKRQHPTLPYFILNYSPEVQYKNKWNNVTLNCRGLILDEDYNIVARPFRKFFNLGQVDLPIQFYTKVEVMDKADGSLGILYPAGDGFAIATRGSFQSEQAIHATKVWNDNYADYVDPTPGYTFLFEIIFPENRIVLNYDGMDDLILLGAVENATGFYLGPREAEAMLQWPGYVVDVYDFNTITDALGAMGRKNKEGYVIRSHNFMVKVKEPGYLELHRLVTNLSPKNVWEMLKAGRPVYQIIADFPDEFHSMVEDIAQPLVEQYEHRLDEIFDGYYSAINNFAPSRPVTRKEYAQVFTKSPDSKYFFALLDGRPINDLLWSELKPREVITAQED